MCHAKAGHCQLLVSVTDEGGSPASEVWVQSLSNSGHVQGGTSSGESIERGELRAGRTSSRENFESHSKVAHLKRGKGPEKAYLFSYLEIYILQLGPASQQCNGIESMKDPTTD